MDFVITTIHRAAIGAKPSRPRMTGSLIPGGLVGRSTASGRSANCISFKLNGQSNLICRFVNTIADNSHIKQVSELAITIISKMRLGLVSIKREAAERGKQVEIAPMTAAQIKVRL